MVFKPKVIHIDKDVMMADAVSSLFGEFYK